MQIKINAIKTTPQYIKITRKEYKTLAEKAAMLDEYRKAQRNRAKRINDILTPQQRSERARKAALSRWQNNKKGNK